jgi:ketosteroid isomerase-like protein
MRYIFIFLLSLYALNTAVAQSRQKTALRKLLEEQSAAWNNGDIEGFMKGYWRSDSLMFIGKKGITYGWQNTLDNYKKSYPGKEAMGRLHFTIIQIRSLSQEYQQVTGKWALQRSIGNLEGYFTLLVRKIRGQWVIIADHSS